MFKWKSLDRQGTRSFCAFTQVEKRTREIRDLLLYANSIFMQKKTNQEQQRVFWFIWHRTAHGDIRHRSVMSGIGNAVCEGDYGFFPFQRAMGKRTRPKSGGISTMRTDEHVTTSRKIVIIDKEQKPAALMDVAIPSDDKF